MSDIVCRSCGELPGTIYFDGNMFCENCANLFGTCAMCKHRARCAFMECRTMPDMTVKRIRQQVPNGYVEQIVQSPNGDKIKTTCMDGKCVCCNNNPEEPRCMRQYGTCPAYEEKEFPKE